MLLKEWAVEGTPCDSGPSMPPPVPEVKVASVTRPKRNNNIPPLLLAPWWLEDIVGSQRSPCHLKRMPSITIHTDFVYWSMDSNLSGVSGYYEGTRKSLLGCGCVARISCNWCDRPKQEIDIFNLIHFNTSTMPLSLLRTGRSFIVRRCRLRIFFLFEIWTWGFLVWGYFDRPLKAHLRLTMQCKIRWRHTSPPYIA